MRNSKTPSSTTPPSTILRHVWPALVVLLVAAAPPPVAATIHFNWLTGTSGAVDDPSKWNPVGVPGAADILRFETPGTYTVTFPSTVPQSASVVCGIGNVTWSPTILHTTGGVFVDLPNGSNSLTMNGGQLDVDFLQLGGSGHFTSMTLANSGSPLATGAIFRSKGINNPTSPSFGDHIGHDGITELNIVGGSRYFSDQVGSSWPMEIATRSTAAATVSIAGFSTGPIRFSQLNVGTNGLTVGAAGVANLFATNGGSITCAGPMMVARDQTASGYVNIGPDAGLGTSTLNAQSDLLIGSNLGIEAGHGEVIVKNHAQVTVGGHTVIGDPDNVVDKQSVLRVLQGGTFTAANGIRVWPTSGVALDLQGGVSRLTGGEFRWPASKALTVSSTTGTPELWISNGTSNIGPSTPAFNAQLSVGGSGVGSLFVTGSGTVFPTGPGAMSVGDLAGSSGTVVVDVSATLSSGGPINVGVHGTGGMQVLAGSFVDVGTGAVGVAAGAVGSVLVSGAGSKLRLRDNLWIGGGFGGVGGTGTTTVDANATLEVLHVNGVNPALITVYPTGTLTLRNGGRLTTTGTLDSRGTTTLDGGTIEALNIIIPATGTLGGAGAAQLGVGITTSGTIDPHTSVDVVSTIGVFGTLQQFPQSHYVADLRNGGAGGCDFLVLTGAATLAGTLDLRTASGFVGNPGETFTILACGSRTGTFANVTWNGGPLADHATVVYESNAVRIVIPTITGVETEHASQAVTELRFTPTGNHATVSFALNLPTAADVDVTLYDVRGREVASLYEGALGAGRHTLASPGNRAAASGVYFARAVIRSEGRTEVRSARSVVVH